MRPEKNKLTRQRARIYKALSDPVRLEIVEFLREGEKCVCEIIHHADLIQPLVSRHLKILKDCGLVKDRKEGNRRFYSLVDVKILRTIDSLSIEIVEGLSKHLMEQIAE